MQHLNIRTYLPEDQLDVITLWQECGLIVPWNNPETDIAAKHLDSPELFFVGELQDALIASCMAGYDGHRGWIYFLAVKPDCRHRAIASKILAHAESTLAALGCRKVELMIRNANKGIITFYEKNDYKPEPVMVLSKRLFEDVPHNYRTICGE